LGKQIQRKIHPPDPIPFVKEGGDSFLILLNLSFLKGEERGFGE
jgi:hypothetical protein